MIGPMHRRHVLAAGGAFALGLAALRSVAAKSDSARTLQYGINLAGAEFGPLPGIHGREYLYPPAEHFAYFARQGATLVRLPFKWERLQPRLEGTLDADELARLATAVAAGTALGMSVVLDPHNYAKRRIADDGWAQEHAIGSAAVPSPAFAHFWGALAGHFASEPRVHFGLMNEPVGPTPAQWRDVAQSAILAIRTTGARNPIYVPGIAYTGAHSWLQSGNAVMASIEDPADNIVFEVHQYFDSDSSGTHPQAVSSSIGSERIAAFQDWARRGGRRAFLGEFGAARDERSLRALTDLLEEVAANADVWTGCAAWAGGPRWPPDEMFNLEPMVDGAARPQTAILSALARGARPRLTYGGVAPEFALDRRRDGPQALAPGPSPALAALLHLPACTVLMEFAPDAPTRPGPLLAWADLALLAIAADGSIGSDLAPAMRIVPERRAGIRIRCALAIDTTHARVAVGVTGAVPVSLPLTRRGPVQDATIASADLLQLVGLPHMLDPANLLDLVT